MSKRLFIDANIILDFFDSTRLSHKFSADFYNYVLINNYKLFTSCDIITTIYYVDSKNNKYKTLDKIRNINKTLKVIEFSNKEIEQTCALMSEDENYKDLEDTIQYVLAKKLECDMIISNDKNFYAADLHVISSKEFCDEYIK